MFKSGVILVGFIPFLLNSYKCETCLKTFLKKFINDQTLVLVNNSNVFESTIVTLEHPKTLYKIESSTNFINFHSFVERDVNYVIGAKNSEQFKHILASFFKHKQWNPKTKHLVIFNKIYEEGAKQSLGFLWYYDVYNAVIISSSNCKGYTWYPFEDECKCGSFVYLKPFNICSNFDPFYNKEPKSKQCSIKISWEPKFYLITYPEHSKHPNVLKQLLRWIKQRLQVSTSKYKFSNTANMTVLKVIQEMEDEKVDVILNDLMNFYYPIGDSRLEKGVQLFSDEFVWVMPQRWRIPTWLTFYKIFSPIQWLQLALAYLLLLTLWNFTRNSSFPESFFAITRLFLCQNVNNMSCLSRKIIIAVAAFLIIHLSLFFTSRLISLLTNPFHGSIKTLEGLAKMDAKFSYNDYTSELLQYTNYEIWKQLESKRVGAGGELNETRFIEFLEHSLNESNLVFAINSLMLHYRVTNIEEIEIHPIKVCKLLNVNVFSLMLFPCR